MGSSTVVPGILELEATHPGSGGLACPPRFRDQSIILYDRNACCFVLSRCEPQERLVDVILKVTLPLHVIANYGWIAKLLNVCTDVNGIIFEASDEALLPISKCAIRVDSLWSASGHSTKVVR
ncbi:unnamed protein product, partial [Cyprideis torosa]